MDSTDAGAIHASIGRPSAFLAIFERHYELVARYLRRRVDRVLADELAAQVFVVAFSLRDKYDPAQPDARPWLYGIAASLLRSHARAEERELRELARTCIDPLKPTRGRLAPTQEPELARALAALAPEDREVLLLNAWGELREDEIADALDLPLEAVRARLDRARRTIREALAEDSAPAEGASHG